VNYAKEAAAAYEAFLSHTSQRPTAAAFQDFVGLVCQAHYEVAEGRPSAKEVQETARYAAALFRDEAEKQTKGEAA